MATTGNNGASTPSITSPRDGMSGDDSMTPEHLKTSWTGASLDNSLENDPSTPDDIKMGMGRGKPMSALAGKFFFKLKNIKNGKQTYLSKFNFYKNNNVNVEKLGILFWFHSL